MPSPRPTLVIRNSTPLDLARVLEWTDWRALHFLPPLLQIEDVDAAFRDGRFRVVALEQDGVPLAESIVCPAPLRGARFWQLPNLEFVPASECLFWVAVAVAPEARRQGLGRRLFEETLTFAVTTGYPYVVATSPGTGSDAAPLFSQLGFQPVTMIPPDPAGEHAAHLRRTLLDADARRALRLE
jgi:GNAT superfamily N-acetyltransferase